MLLKCILGLTLLITNVWLWLKVCIPRSPCHYRATDKTGRRSQEQPELFAPNAHKDVFPIHLAQKQTLTPCCSALEHGVINHPLRFHSHVKCRLWKIYSDEGHRGVWDSQNLIPKYCSKIPFLKHQQPLKTQPNR